MPASARCSRCSHYGGCVGGDGMKPRCALCDRPMLNPAVLIGTLPVGPKCAKRAGLLELARKRVGRLSLPSVKYRRNEPQENLNLFEEEGA